jgi:hypothetical protein
LGPVFRAYDATRERLVAVKLFKLDLPPDRVHRLVAELQRLVDARLDHPALAAPLATGIVGVSAYLAQEYVAADSLDSVVREYGAAPPADALRVAAQLAGALDFAGVVNFAHGAMHPRDVLLSSDETRLTGVGVARALETVGVAPPLRRPYTAPERMSGGPWDRRADVFSLAALIHELLYARRPAGTGQDAADALGEAAGGDRDRLRTAFARALADDPGDRFATTLEFVQALHAAFPGVTLAPAERREREQPRPINGRSTVARAGEPLLPLDEAAEPTVIAPARIAPPAAAPPDDFASDMALRAAEEARYDEVEAAPAIVEQPPARVEPTLIDHRLDDVEDTVRAQVNPAPEPPLMVEIPPVADAIDDSEAAERAPQFGSTPASALERSRSAVWPLAMALLVGLAVGFAGGYGVGSQNRSEPATGTAAAEDATPAASPTTTAPATPRREFTENTVPAAPKPAPVRPAPEAAASEPGRLLVRTTPAGARVSVDGKDYGRTPVAVRELARGTHRVRITRDGYAAVDRRVVITAARPSQSLTVPLERPADARATSGAAAPAPARGFSGTLLVDSRPSGAKVYLDGQLSGTTPLSLNDVRAGEHAIRLEREGYRRWSSSVRVVATEQNRVTASLER